PQQGEALRGTPTAWFSLPAAGPLTWLTCELDRAPQASLNSHRLLRLLMKGIRSCTSTGTGVPRAARQPCVLPAFCRAGRPFHALFRQCANSSASHGGTSMREYTLGVGDELVIEDDIRLTLLAVEAGEVLLAITAPEPSDAAGPGPGEDRQDD